jgi:hypothetical protein
MKQVANRKISSRRQLSGSPLYTAPNTTPPNPLAYHELVLRASSLRICNKDHPTRTQLQLPNPTRHANQLCAQLINTSLQDSNICSTSATRAARKMLHVLRTFSCYTSTSRFRDRQPTLAIFASLFFSTACSASWSSTSPPDMLHCQMWHLSTNCQAPPAHLHPVLRGGCKVAGHGHDLLGEGMTSIRSFALD